MAKILLNVTVDPRKAEEGLNQIKESIQKIVTDLGELKPNQDLTKQLNALARAYAATEKAATSELRVQKEKAALEAKLAKLEADTAKAIANKSKATSQASQAAEKAVQEIEKTRAATEKANAEAAKAKTALENHATAIEKRRQAEEKTNQEAAKTLMMEEKLYHQTEENTEGNKKYAQSVETLGSKFGDLLERYAKYYASSLLIRKPLQLIQNALSDVGETLVKTEDAVIELNRVLDDPQPAQEISGRLYDLAYKYGQTFENASTIAANFARTGRDFNESIKATEAALLAMNVAELDATQASEGLISILAQFKKAPEDLLTVVDQLNKAADKNPVTTGKLLTALQRTGSSANNANLSLERTVGIITALSEATNRSGQNLGTAVNSLLQYSSKAESLDLFASLSESAAKTVEAYRIGAADIVDVWKAVSVEINRLQSESAEKQDELFRKFDTEEVEQLSSSLHDELGDIFEQIGGVYDVANTYRKNYFIALLANMDKVFDVEKQISDAQGYSQAENEKYMQTYTALVNQLNAEWQKLANDEQGFLGFKKDLVEAGIAAIHLVDDMGGIAPVIVEIASAVGVVTGLVKAGDFARKVLEIKANMLGLEVQTVATSTAVQGLSTAFSYLSIGAAILTGIITLTVAYNREQEQARQKTIEIAKAHAEDAKKLQDLYDRYKDLSPESEEYRDIENEIVNILGDKAGILKNVTEKTGDYKKAVEELTEAQLAQFEMEQFVARQAAEKSLLADATSFSLWYTGEAKFYTGAVENSSARSVQELTPQQILDYYDRLIEKQKELANEFSKSGDASERTKLSKQYEDIGKQIDAVKDKVEAYRSTLVGANDVIIHSTVKLQDHIVGREGVVPNLEEVIEKSQQAAEATDELADSEEDLSDITGEAAAELEDFYLFTDETKETAKELTDNIKNLTQQIDDAQNAIKVLTDAQAEYDEYGSLSVDTLQKLLELGGEYLDLIIDEEGQIQLNEDAIDGLISAKQELVNKLIAEQVQEYAVNKLHEYMEQSTADMGDEAIEAAQKIELAAMALAHFEGNEQGAKRAAEDFEEALHRLALHEGVFNADWEEDWVSDVKNFRSGLTSLYASTDQSRSSWTGRSSSKSSSSSSSKSEKDPYLENLKSAVSLRESELTLMEHQGAAQDQQIAKIKEIQSAIHDQAEYMRSIGASQEDINKLSSDWWKWQEKINKFAEDNAKAAEKAAKEAEKLAEEQKKAAEEAIKAETARRKQAVADDKAKLNLMQKQGKSVSEQVEQMKKIQEHLHDEAEWLREIKAEQAEIDTLSAEWWDWQEKILKLYKETLDAARDLELEAQQKVIDGILNEIKLEEEALEISEKRLAVDEARANLEDAIAKAKLDYVQTVLSDYITALDDAETLESKRMAVIEAREKLVQAEREAQAKSIIDTFKAEKDVKNDTLSLEEKRLAVEKARQALIDAENNRTTRVLNEATGQWEYQADAKAVQSAKDNLKSAVDALNAYVEEAAWNEVAEVVENGSVSEAEVLDILSKWAKEAYGNGSPEFVAKIQSAFRKAMGSSSSPDSVSGQISAVDSAVKSLNDYLKSEAVKELKAYIAAGNTDASGMKSILDKWLSMGEGGELYEWRDGLLDSVNGAIESGYYDDSKVQSQIQAVENAVDSLHEYLRSRFISEITDLVKNGTAEEIRAAIERWSNDFDLSETDRDWANRLVNAKDSYEKTEASWNSITPGSSHTDEEKRSVMERMRANSEAWWTASEEEKKRLSELNYILGTSMGWHRESNGAWYDERNNRVYDKGGVLRGRGGIKATDKPEIILDPELTAKILRPGSESQFRAFADAMHLMFEHGERGRTDKPVIRPISSTDSHNTSYTVNGIPIGAGAAERYTIAELFRMMPTAR